MTTDLRVSLGSLTQHRARVTAHRRIACDHYLLSLACAPIAQAAQPGQFVHLHCSAKPLWHGGGPLLRRPFSLYDVDRRRGICRVIYKVVGLGTASLQAVAVGDTLDLIGPLGTSFVAGGSVRRAVLIGGGVGIPPLYFWAKTLNTLKISSEAFLGVQTKDYLICDGALRQLGVPTRVATDDGSAGFHGYVTGLVERSFRRAPPRGGTTLYICGPTPMMQAAAALAGRRGLPAQVSLEERMGCALGVCMGCIVEIAGPHATAHKRFQRVCTEGPVFDAEAVVWR
jgi:dihydroorotate dehydrogenase electron transfer subunit